MKEKAVKREGKTVNFKNELFEILPTKNDEFKHTLKFKGKIICNNGLNAGDFLEFNVIDKNFEKILDIDGTLFPEVIELGLDKPESAKDRAPYLLTISRKKTKVTFEFLFIIEEYQHLNMNVNPVKHLIHFFELLTAAGYKTDFVPEENHDEMIGIIEITMAAKGNLKVKYEELIKKIGTYYTQASAEMGFKDVLLISKNPASK